LEEVDGPVMGLLEYMSLTLSSVMNPIWRSHDHEATIRKNQYTSANFRQRCFCSLKTNRYLHFGVAVFMVRRRRLEATMS
jgi:hypothetical protein